MTSAILDEENRAGALFIVWGPPSHGPRSRVFARELGIPLENVFSTTRRGLWVAPWKYAYQAVATTILLWRRRPRLVFVQSPPSQAVWFVALYCMMSGARFVVDAHSAALQSGYWTRPEALYRALARQALATIVTNETFASRIEGWGARAFILRDIPTAFPTGDPPDLADSFHILVVSTFAFDEPLGEVIDAARRLPEATFHVTGDPTRGRTTHDLSSVPGNVRLTGYLADADYYSLMTGVDAVMCLTTRDDTMQRGACEALTIGTPIITSDWPLLRRYFSDGTVHVAAHADAIEAGIRRAMSDIAELRAGILRLRAEQWNEWVKASAGLATLIKG
jgi:glycosyltransferase involved in cell wall biosynthesis